MVNQKTMKNIRTYSELITIPTFEERYQYLRLGGRVGEETFGFDRYINQIFYKSKEWLSIRDYVILRDNACDLGMEGYEIRNRILIHHMNPITVDDILKRSEFLLNPEYLICTIKNTHDAIKYGYGRLQIPTPIVRKKKERGPWEKGEDGGGGKWMYAYTTIHLNYTIMA